MPKGKYLRKPGVALIERFWNFVARGADDECWPWRGSTRGNYGSFGESANKKHSAHRFAYMRARGPIPSGMLVCHRCDNPPCCNPRHLFLGTHADNKADAVAKGRAASGERHGRARLTATQVSEIRASRETRTELARRFGVGRTTVRHILDGRNWRVGAP